MRLFFLGLLVGIIIGAAGAVFYAEWVVSGLDEELLEGAPADQR